MGYIPGVLVTIDGKKRRVNSQDRNYPQLVDKGC